MASEGAELERFSLCSLVKDSLRGNQPTGSHTMNLDNRLAFYPSYCSLWIHSSFLSRCFVYLLISFTLSIGSSLVFKGLLFLQTQLWSSLWFSSLKPHCMSLAWSFNVCFPQALNNPVTIELFYGWSQVGFWTFLGGCCTKDGRFWETSSLVHFFFKKVTLALIKRQLVRNSNCLSSDFLSRLLYGAVADWLLPKWSGLLNQ